MALRSFAAALDAGAFQPFRVDPWRNLVGLGRQSKCFFARPEGSNSWRKLGRERAGDAQEIVPRLADGDEARGGKDILDFAS